MRSIPFKVVCLLGMNDGELSAHAPPLGSDLMAQQVKRGDRSRRDDDRYLFLEAILSAQQRLYISFIGRSIQDNSPRYPSGAGHRAAGVPGSKAIVCRGDEELSADDSARLVGEHLLKWHARMPFAAENFLPGSRRKAMPPSGCPPPMVAVRRIRRSTSRCPPKRCSK